MEQESAQRPHDDATPIFEAYRRGYEPEQVDRFVADQQRRLDETLTRATEAERRLAAAVGQLRELHRRVTTLESEGRSPQAQPLDTVGERIQRILQEAWEGAHAIRQSAEDEMAELRQRTLEQAEEIVAMARQKAKSIDEEIGRRRRAYLGKIEEERNKAVAQINSLHERRNAVLEELVRMKSEIELTVDGAVAITRQKKDVEPSVQAVAEPPALPRDVREVQPMRTPSAEGEHRNTSHDARPTRPRTVRDISPKTMPVVHLAMENSTEASPDASDLVRSHRAAMESTVASPAARVRSLRRIDDQSRHSSVFDFEEESPT